jgi:hypothetical protein
MRLRWLVLTLIVALPVPRSPAAAQAADVPLPHLSACIAAERPQLPQRWGATFLMAPFTAAQLVLAEIVHDGSVPATRARLYGLAHGTVDILVAGRRTYLLTTEEGRLGDCRAIGDTGARPPPSDWLGRKAQCVGSAPVAETAAEWWKAPASQPPLANWFWFAGADRTPLRLMFVSADLSLFPLSLFAFSYRVRFEARSTIDLADAVAFCRARTQPVGVPVALADTIAAMEQAGSRADIEIKRLMPELATCAGHPLPRWPDDFAMATLMTPIDMHHAPLAAEVLYRWGLRSQRTRILFPPATREHSEDVLLIGSTGYGVTHRRSGGPTCAGPQPGAVRPDWTATGSCSCQAVIDGTTALTPYGPSQILRCPMTAPRVVWTWYTLDGRPIVFMETASGHERGALLTLADYYAWMPDHRSADASFAKPKQCVRPPSDRSARAPLRPCLPCHLGNEADR